MGLARDEIGVREAALAPVFLAKACCGAEVNYFLLFFDKYCPQEFLKRNFYDQIINCS